MKIFISNLSLLVTEDDLDLIFKPFGEVGEIKILRDRQSDLPLAFVEMKNDAEASAATTNMTSTNSATASKMVALWWRSWRYHSWLNHP